MHAQTCLCFLIRVSSRVTLTSTLQPMAALPAIVAPQAVSVGRMLNLSVHTGVTPPAVAAP